MPYYDYGGFGQSYFEGENVSSPNAAGYDLYHKGLLPFDFYAQKIHDELNSQGIDPSGERVLVVGCGYGYTVEYLIDNYNVDAYGMDISTWAVNQADTEIAYGNRIYQGDVLNQADIQSVATSAGGDFSVIFNECVLECLTDSEADTAQKNMQQEARNAVVHRVWTDGRVNSNYYNSKTLSGWQQLLDKPGKDYWYSDTSFQP